MANGKHGDNWNIDAQTYIVKVLVYLLHIPVILVPVYSILVPTMMMMEEMEDGGWRRTFLCFHNREERGEEKIANFGLWTFTPPKSQILDFFEDSISKQCHPLKKTILHMGKLI